MMLNLIHTQMNLWAQNDSQIHARPDPSEKYLNLNKKRWLCSEEEGESVAFLKSNAAILYLLSEALAPINMLN